MGTAPSSSARPRSPSPSSGGAWLLPVVLLLATGAGLSLALRGPSGIFGWVVGALVATSLLWVLISALWPARADRTCPTCGEDAVRRLDPQTTYGLVCRACGWRDETASSWLLAEEEGPLEDIVLNRRGGRKAGEPHGQTPRDELEGRGHG